MSYGDFTLSKVVKQFQLTVDERSVLFPDVADEVPSKLLLDTLEEGVPLALAQGTEKARSELIIAPVLMEVRRRKDRTIALFSGVDFNVDAAQGLSGTCDFLLSRSLEQIYVRAPVMMVAEAKREDFARGIAQCAAELVAARIFNQQEGSEVPVLHGVVTTGNNWRFLRLRDNLLQIDRQEYYIERVGRLIGALLAALA
jgi:hypothetical protein